MSRSPGQNNRRPVAIILEDRPRRRIVYKRGAAKGKNMVKCERGKVVSKKACATGMRVYKHIQAWTRFFKTARKANKVVPSVKKTSSPKLHRGV